jgi:hypothetical protein
MNQALTPQPQIVYGLRIGNPRLATRTRRVLVVAVVSMIAIIIGRGFDFFKAGGASGGPLFLIFNLAVGLLIPCCGYFGAKKSDQNLTCCYCGCNFLGACLGIFQIVSLAIAVQGLQYLAEYCEPDHASQECPKDMNTTWQKMCPDLSPEKCWHKTTDGLPDLHSAMIVPYVERFMHHFGGNILVPQCAIFEGIVRTGPPPK